jgi:hypothetical protein
VLSPSSEFWRHLDSPLAEGNEAATLDGSLLYLQQSDDDFYDDMLAGILEHDVEEDWEGHRHQFWRLNE